MNNLVLFLGSIPNNNLPLFYSAADILVVPSIKSARGQEGLPVTIIEGLLSRCNIVATSVGGILDLADFESIYLVKPQDERELAAGIIRCLGKKVPVFDNRIQNFFLSNVAKNFCQEYKKLITSRVK